MRNDSSAKYCIGYSLNDEIRFKSSSGGIGTEIIRYLLLSKEFNTSVTFYFDETSCQYRPRLIYSPDEINITGSIYQDINILEFLKDNISEIKGSIVLTCPPCQVAMIRTLLNKHSIKSFIITFACSGQTTLEGTYFLYKCLGIKKENVNLIQYRGNGWPSGIQIYLKNGKKIFRKNYSYPWNIIHKSYFFRPKRCIYCKLDTSNKSDMSIADPWLPQYINNDKVGSTLFVAFSEKSKDVLDTMLEKKYIYYENVPYSCYFEAQKNNLSKAVNLYKNKEKYDIIVKLTNNKLIRLIFLQSLLMLKIYCYLIKRLNFKGMFKRNIKKIIQKIRYQKYKNKFSQCGNNVYISSGCTINNPECLYIGNSVGIGKNCFFLPVKNHSIDVYTPKIIIGDNTYIDDNCSIMAIKEVKIGKNVLFARNVHITDHSHGYEDINLPIKPQRLITKGGIVIEDDCWLGFNCEILSGVKIGKHSIVAARAVVTKDVPEYSIVAGNPAKIVKKYNFETNKWEKI